MGRRKFLFKYFVNRVPLDRDGQNNKTDTFANLENIKSSKEPTRVAPWRFGRVS